MGTSLKWAIIAATTPYVRGCEKEGGESFLYDNEFGVMMYANRVKNLRKMILQTCL